MSTEVKSDTPEPVAVTEDGTNSIVHPGDAANKAVRVNLVAGAGPSGGPSSAFDAAFPASGFGAGAKASAAAPSYGEGNMVALSVDLTGALRTAGGSGGGGLTDTQLRASPVPVSGPLTDTQLRASAVPVSTSSLPLPAGAATEATLALVKAKTDNLDVLLSSRTKPSDIQPVSGTFWQATQPVSGTFWQSTQPVSITSLPLPSNAAQETGGHIASLDTKQPALGAAATASSSPVNIASDQTVPISAASLPLPTGAATAARQDTGNTSMAGLDGKLPAQGQAQMSASLPVAIALDQVGIYERYDRRVIDEQRFRLADGPTRNADRGTLTDRRARQERGFR